MKKYFVFLICFQLITLYASAQSEKILSRYKEYLFLTIKPNNVDWLITSLNENNGWTDINYNDEARANWQVSEHLARVVELAVAWKDKKSAFYQNKTLWKTINLALNHWLEKRYKNTNWWHNEIGVPNYMRDIIILLRDDLSPRQLSESMEILAQHRVDKNVPRGRLVGANLLWTADLTIHYAALIKDEKLLKRFVDLVVKEIQVTKVEGIQPDFSFHQHGARLQMYQYGKAFVFNNIRLAWQLEGTSWAIPQEKVDLLVNFVLEGWQWMARGVNTVPGTIDRSVSREGELKSADIRLLIPFLIKLKPEESRALKAIADLQNGKGMPLGGYRYYPYSDFTAYHRKDFSFFVKTISTRTYPTESFSGENLKGGLLNSGDAYLIRDGNEYFNLMPVWNWELLPGITTFGRGGSVKRQSFAGGVGDKTSGLTVMDYHLDDKERSLSGYKFWAAHEDMVVCLISNLKVENATADVLTALDQCRWRGDVTVNKAGNILREGDNHIKNVKWIHHSGFAYIPLKAATFNVHLNSITKDWSVVNSSQSKRAVTEKVFLPVMVHENPSYSTGYVLASCSNPADADKLAEKPKWQILKNDQICQAVRFKDGTLMAGFFSVGTLKIHINQKIDVNRPCILMIAKHKLYVSDATHKGGEITIQINNKIFSFTLNEDGTSKEIHL